MVDLLQLPNEILLLIASYLEPEDRAYFGSSFSDARWSTTSMLCGPILKELTLHPADGSQRSLRWCERQARAQLRFLKLLGKEVLSLIQRITVVSSGVNFIPGQPLAQLLARKLELVFCGNPKVLFYFCHLSQQDARHCRELCHIVPTVIPDDQVFLIIDFVPGPVTSAPINVSRDFHLQVRPTPLYAISAEEDLALTREYIRMCSLPNQSLASEALELSMQGMVFKR